MNQPRNRFLTSFYPWIVFLLSASFLFYKYLIEVSPSVLANELMREFQILGTQLGNLTSFYFYAYLIMQIPVGLLLDRFGPRVLTSCAIVFCALGALLLADAQSFYLACLGRFISGTGAAFAAISCFKLITIWFKPNRFAFMAGLMMTAGMLGAVGGQAPLAASISALGWRPTLNAIAIVGIIFGIVFLIVVRSKNELTKVTRIKTKNFTESICGIVKKRQNWLLSIFSGLAFAPVSVVGGLWGVPFITQAYHLSKTAAASNISLIFIGFAIGAPLFGILSDQIGKRKPLVYVGMILAFVLICIALFCTAIPTALLSIIMFGFGFFISAFLISFTMIREINPLAFAATSVATMNTLNAVLCAFSDPFIGKLLDLFWKGKMKNGAPVFQVVDYQFGLATLPAYLFLGLVIFYFVKETDCKQLEDD